MARFLLLSSLLFTTLIHAAPQSLDELGTFDLPVDVFSAKKPTATTTYPVVITLHDDVVKDEVANRIIQLMDSSAANNNYKADFDGTVVNGLAGNFTAKILNTIQDEFPDLVKAVEPDYIMTVSQGWKRFTPFKNLISNAPVTKQDPVANWGQARICQKTFNQTQPFIFPSSAGEGVDVFHIDTGIFEEHADFDHKLVKLEKNFVPEEFEPRTDMSGHGTHTAGVIVGQKYGVAKKARLRSIKALNARGQGRMSDILGAIEYAARQHLKGGRRQQSVLTMSIGGPQSVAVNTAINACYAAGMFVVAASGNDGKDGCNFSPGSATGAFAVGAVDKNDVMPPWSNFGACTNMYAPGVDVRSTWIAVVPGGAVAPPGWLDFPAVYLSGTSMAAPYVSAVAALIMATNPFTDVRYVTSQLNRMSLNGVIKGLPTGSINRLLNMQNLSYNWYNRNIRFNGNRNVLPSSVQTWDDLLKAASKIAPFKAGTVVNGPPPMPGIATKSESNAVFSVNSVGDKKAKTDDDDENEDGKKDKHDDDTAVVDTTPPPPADGMMVAAPVGDATA